MFRAISDPTRREILYFLVAASAAMNIVEISNKFAVTRQGITKHIKILETAGLVKIKKQGRESFCFATPQKLKAVYNWVSFYEPFWTDKLISLGQYLDRY